MRTLVAYYIPISLLILTSDEAHCPNRGLTDSFQDANERTFSINEQADVGLLKLRPPVNLPSNFNLTHRYLKVRTASKWNPQ